jgi:deoxyadenosine/deoxycytidine kinase
MEVAVEGPIGCGKSSVLKALCSLNICNIQPEPVADWQPLLKRFYADKTRWALALQLKVLLSFADPPNSLLVTTFPTLIERSAASCKYVFGTLLMKRDEITACEWDVFCHAYEALQLKGPRCCIMIDVPPEECMLRARKRAREEEKVDLDYMTAVDESYRAFISYDREKARRGGKQGMWLGSSPFYERVIVIDGLKPASEVAESAKMAICLLERNLDPPILLR